MESLDGSRIPLREEKRGSRGGGRLGGRISRLRGTRCLEERAVGACLEVRGCGGGGGGGGGGSVWREGVLEGWWRGEERLRVERVSCAAARAPKEMSLKEGEEGA